MKQNTFYICIGIIGILEVLFFWASIQLSNPFIIAMAFLVGAVLYFALHRQVTDRYVDERQNLIDMKTASATLKAFWVSFFSVNLAAVAYVFSGPLGLSGISIKAVVIEPAERWPRLMQSLNETGIPDHMNQVAITLHTNVSNVTDAVASGDSLMQMHQFSLFPAPPEMIAISHLGVFGMIQIFLLVLMMFIYVGFRMYYSHKFGEWYDDEE